MAAIEKKPIKITETVLRDAHQSLIATRLTTEQMLPIVDKMDKVGYHSVESCMKIHGQDFVNSVTDSRTPNFRCSSVDRTSLDTVHTQMM